MALSGGGPSIAGTNVLFREVHKNSWLRRLAPSDKKTGFHPKKGERVWTVFCVHDDIEPFLELYNDQKVAASHKPDWSVSLSNTLHISPTICPQDEEFEFVITLPDVIVRLMANSWDVMMEWVDSIGAKLREMHILSPKENVYSRMPEMRVPLLPTRDPNSPLPLPPVGPLTVVPGVEPLSVNVDVTQDVNEQINERQAPSNNHGHPNNAPVSMSTVYIAHTLDIPAVYASSSSTPSISIQVPPDQDNVTVIQVKSDAFDFDSLSEYLPMESLTPGDQSEHNNGNVVRCEGSSGEDNEKENGDNDDEDEGDNDDDVFSAPLSVTPLLPRIPNQLQRNRNCAQQKSSSHSSRLASNDDNPSNGESCSNKNIAQRKPQPIPRVSKSVNVKRHHSFNNQSSSATPADGRQAVPRPQNEAQVRNRNRERVRTVSESNTNSVEHSTPTPLTTSSETRVPCVNDNIASGSSTSNNCNNSAGHSGSGSSNSSSSSNNSNINLYEHVFLSSTQQQPVSQQQRAPVSSTSPLIVIQHESVINEENYNHLDHNTPPPAPVVSSGRGRSGLRPTRRRSSESSVNAGGAPVAADRIRRLQPAPHPFRQNSSITDCDSVSTRLTLREQQVLQLRREMSHPGGVRLQLRRKDCLNSIGLVDAFGAVWVVGWKQKDHPMLYNALHIGDQIISVAGVRVLNSSDAQKLIRGAPSLYVAFVIRRVPFGRVFALKRESEGQSLGLVQEGGTAEIKDVIAGSLASSQGLPPRTPSVDGLTLTTWSLTEINGRPLNLFFKENEVKDRLNAVGLDISLLVQPSDLIKQFKKQIKSLRSYKDYIVQ